MSDTPTRSITIMSHAQEPTIGDDELATTTTAGYKVGEKKSLAEYSQLDAEDESLARWKASLGIGASTGAVDPNAPKVSSAPLREALQCC